MIIKLVEDPNYVGIKTLDGNQYQIQVRWNTTTQCWYLSLIGVTNQIIIRGIALLPGKDLLRPYGYRGVLGPLWLRDTSGANDNPTFTGIGSRWVLEYIPLRSQ